MEIGATPFTVLFVGWIPVTMRHASLITTIAMLMNMNGHLFSRFGRNGYFQFHLYFAILIRIKLCSTRYGGVGISARQYSFGMLYHRNRSCIIHRLAGSTGG